LSQSAPSTPSSTPPNLGQRAFGGAIWTLGNTLGSKFAGIVSQLILAALLTQHDFGRVAQVIFIVSLASLGSQLGIGEILIRRHRKFNQWASIAFWISLAAGLLGAVLIAAITPFTSYLFKDSDGLAPLLLVGACTLPFDAMALVFQSKLRIDLRFRTLALLGGAGAIAMAVLSVAFAASRLIWPNSPVAGAMAVILPRPLIAAMIMITSYRLTDFRPRLRFSFRRWPFVLRDSRYFFITGLFMTFLMQGDYLIAGMFFTTQQLGVYYFAFNLSMQTVQLVGGNLTSILLPSFAKLDQEPARQRAAYLKVCSTIMLVGTLICILQGILAGPLLQLFFKNKWDDAILLFQILTIGMIFILPTSPGIALMHAQGLFRRVMVWTMVTALSFLFSVTVGALFGSTMTIAIAIAIFYAVFSAFGVIVPLRFTPQAFMEIVRRVYAFPIGAGLAAVATCIAIAYAFPAVPPLVRAIAMASGATLTYAIAVLAWRRNDLRELLGRFQPYIMRFSRSA
jgi:PST family polysaccharide transporter